MSIDSVGPNTNAQTVNPLDAAIKANQENQKIEVEQPVKQEKQDLSEQQKEKAVEGFYSGTGMSTQDFMVLRAQASEDSFKVLDEVISKMKENMEGVGDAIEALTEMVKENSKDNIALQVLQKTLDAMDENSNDKE